MTELSGIDRSALELLATARSNAELEITESAQKIQESFLADNPEVSLTSLLGAEALALYGMLEKREAYFMRERSWQDSLAMVAAIGNFALGNRVADSNSERRIRNYAQCILTARDGDLNKKEATRWARQEISRVDQTQSNEEMMRHHGYKNFRQRMSASGYAYFSPPIAVTEPENIDGFLISQQWRVKAELPCTHNGWLRVLTTLHEFKHGPERKTTPLHTIKINDDDEVDEANTYVKGKPVSLSEDQLAFPHGLLIASREAVIASVPKRISKKW